MDEYEEWICLNNPLGPRQKKLHVSREEKRDTVRRGPHEVAMGGQRPVNPSKTTKARVQFWWDPLPAETTFSAVPKQRGPPDRDHATAGPSRKRGGYFRYRPEAQLLVGYFGCAFR